MEVPEGNLAFLEMQLLSIQKLSAKGDRDLIKSVAVAAYEEIQKLKKEQGYDDSERIQPRDHKDPS
jgi:hypothetical protein